MSDRRNARRGPGYYPHNAAFDEEGRYLLGQIVDENNNIAVDLWDAGVRPPSQGTIRNEEGIDPATAHLRAPAAQMAWLKPEKRDLL